MWLSQFFLSLCVCVWLSISLFHFVPLLPDVSVFFSIFVKREIESEREKETMNERENVCLCICSFLISKLMNFVSGRYLGIKFVYFLFFNILLHIIHIFLSGMILFLKYLFSWIWIFWKCQLLWSDLFVIFFRKNLFRAHVRIIPE